MIARALRTRVAAIWLLLAALVGVIAVTEYTDPASTQAGGASRADPSRLLPVAVGQLAAVEVADAGTRHRFERGATGAWFYHGAHTGAEAAHAHAVDPAEAERIERALLAFGRTRIERRVGRPPDAGAYGVTTPRIIILAYRANDPQPVVQYAVGDMAPDTVSRYVDVVGGVGVVTIPSYPIDSLLTLIRGLEAGRGSDPR